MRTAIFSVVAVFVLVSYVFAQPVQPSASDEQVRTSTVAPDLHNSASGWNMVAKEDGRFVEVPYQDKVLTLQGSKEYYMNDKNQTRAYLYLKTDANGNGEEFAMLYGTNDVAKGAIKVNGKWYVSKETYFDHGLSNPNGTVNQEFVYDEKETNRPVKVKYTLETVDGHKEVVLDLKLQ